MRYVVLMTLLSLSLFAAPTIAYGLLWLAGIMEGPPLGSVSSSPARGVRQTTSVRIRESVALRG
jgi:hypothetical protein